MFKYFIGVSLLTLSLSSCGRSVLPLTPMPTLRTASYVGLYQTAKKLFHDTFISQDTNQDGQLTPLESGLDQQAFDELDLNGDRYLVEMERFPPTAYVDFIQSIKEMARQEMQMYDRDQDQTLTYDEFKPYASHHTTDAQTQFKQTDRNGNGVLSISEFEDCVAKVFAGTRKDV